jgi:hypothetical protein
MPFINVCGVPRTADERQLRELKERIVGLMDIFVGILTMVEIN